MDHLRRRIFHLKNYGENLRMFVVSVALFVLSLMVQYCKFDKFYED